MADIEQTVRVAGRGGGGRHAGRVARSVRAQVKPDKLVYIGENQGGWKRVLMEEVGPAFEKPPASRWSSRCCPSTPGARA